MFTAKSREVLSSWGWSGGWNTKAPGEQQLLWPAESQCLWIMSFSPESHHFHSVIGGTLPFACSCFACPQAVRETLPQSYSRPDKEAPKQFPQTATWTLTSLTLNEGYSSLTNIRIYFNFGYLMQIKCAFNMVENCKKHKVWRESCWHILFIRWIPMKMHYYVWLLCLIHCRLKDYTPIKLIMCTGS